MTLRWMADFLPERLMAAVTSPRRGIMGCWLKPAFADAAANAHVG